MINSSKQYAVPVIVSQLERNRILPEQRSIELNG